MQEKIFTLMMLLLKVWSDRDNPNAETFDISQGWYDAGDYGKYVSPAATSVENLLLAYELFPRFRSVPYEAKTY